GGSAGAKGGAGGRGREGRARGLSTPRGWGGGRGSSGGSSSRRPREEPARTNSRGARVSATSGHTAPHSIRCRDAVLAGSHRHTHRPSERRRLLPITPRRNDSLLRPVPPW